MDQLTTGEINHDQLYDEARFIQELLREAGVRTVTVCCAFGVDPDDPLFAREVEIEVGGLADYFLDHERAGSFDLGSTNITLTTELEGLRFFFGNDHDVFCWGEESGRFAQVRQRWSGRYPRSG